jgi:hypothetical protein
MTHLFVGARTCASRTENAGTGLESGIETGSSILDARVEASLDSRKAGSLQASMTSIDTSPVPSSTGGTSVYNLKRKLHFMHFTLTCHPEAKPKDLANEKEILNFAALHSK